MKTCRGIGASFTEKKFPCGIRRNTLMKRTIHVTAREPQYIVNTDVTFAQVSDWFGHMTRDLKLDIVYPEQGDRKSPCIIWICGGAWRQMRTSAHLAYLCGLARRGFAAASVEYRTSNETTFPGQLEDIKAAIRYLRAHAGQYGIDTERFGVMGESAGAHLAALAACTGELPEYEKGQYLEYPSSVQAACCWYLPADLSGLISRTPKERQAATPEALLIGTNPAQDKERACAASPCSLVTAQTPPFLLLHGTEDQTVPFSQSEQMYDALMLAGVDAELVAIDGAQHAGIEFFQREVWDIIREFFKKKLK